MNSSFSYKKIPRSRIATFDTFSVGLLKHHVSAILDFDVTDSRKKFHKLRKNGLNGPFNGWIIPTSVHPLSFGIGSVLKKPAVIADEIKIREILNMTILVDHDVIDGAPMVRFLNDLTKFIESGEFADLTYQ